MPNNSILSLNPILLHIRTPFLEPQITYFKIYPFPMLQYQVTKFITKIIMKITPNLHRSSLGMLNTATAWPNLIFFLSPQGQRIWSTQVGFFSFFFFCRLPFLSHLVGQSEKEQNPKLVAETAPGQIFFLFRAKFPNTPLYQSSTKQNQTPLSDHNGP